jgi:2-amino-4-hydroxy-6-hydroxymethyldihydropteridine diphosphokinase
MEQTSHSLTHSVFISLGSNLGDRPKNLESAIVRMQAKVEVTLVSKIYETPPWGVLDQPAFLNQVLQGSTDLSPFKLLTFLKNIEKEMGRKRSIRFGPRLIDLDILLYNQLLIDTPRLTIPHKRMCERAFVMVPLSDIDTKLIVPGTHRTIEEYLQLMDTSSIIQVDPAINGGVTAYEPR